jgi:Fe-S-cluster containining protein
MDSQPLLQAYSALLSRIDTWFAGALARYPDRIACRTGCSGCCRGLFDITVLDAALLRQGFRQLSPAVRRRVTDRARRRVAGLTALRFDFTSPFLLNILPETDWEELMPDGDETPCVLLDRTGRCRVYEHRPMTCRLHGLPLMDLSGEIMHDEWCTENFPGMDPLALSGLRAPFAEIFREEVRLGRLYTGEMLGEAVRELDTFIPAALLVDYDRFPWRRWWEQNRDRVAAATVSSGPGHP